MCAYISSVLRHSGLVTGRFTTPHLIDRWDCICVNDEPIPKATFFAVESHIHELNRKNDIRATEFELLTATAFELFSRLKVQVAVVEVGIGGRDDATNVFDSLGGEPIVTVITKMGMDHEGFLGETLGEIARHKAGILKRGVPVVIDGSTAPQALGVVEEVAKEVEAGELRKVMFNYDYHDREKEAGAQARFITKELDKGLGELEVKISLHGRYQYQNAQVAVEAIAIASRSIPEITRDSVVKGIESARWAGRLDWVDLSPLAPSLNRSVLLDGAHNPQAARELGQYVDRLRKEGRRSHVNWVIGITKGKDVDEILQPMLRPGDSVYAVPFGEVDGMPWVKPTEPGDIIRAAKKALGEDAGGGMCAEGKDELEGLEKAVVAGNGREIVVAGSLWVDLSCGLHLTRGQLLMHIVSLTDTLLAAFFGISGMHKTMSDKRAESKRCSHPSYIYIHAHSTYILK